MPTDCNSAHRLHVSEARLLRGNVRSNRLLPVQFNKNMISQPPHLVKPPTNCILRKVGYPTKRQEL
ncbi:MAG: hypothetical protein ABIQ44_12495, partial [Chloroflexia bacterium]